MGEFALEVKEEEYYIGFKFCDGMKNSFVKEPMWYLVWIDGTFVVGEVDFTCRKKRGEAIVLDSAESKTETIKSFVAM